MLDPCEDENEDIQDDDASLGVDSVQRDGSSESDSEVTANCLIFLTLNSARFSIKGLMFKKNKIFVPPCFIRI